MYSPIIHLGEGEGTTDRLVGVMVPKDRTSGEKVIDILVVLEEPSI
jgi:hypothetical protein